MPGRKDSNAALAWERLKKSVLETEPQDLVKFVVLVVCCIMVYVQLQDCLSKLNNPPVTTHSSLTLNESMSYPALTICREPPYNRMLYQKFNFAEPHVGPYPVHSMWKYFPYDMYNISAFWDEAVYNQSILTSYGLNGLAKNVELSSSIHFTTGMCHTVRPMITVDAVGKNNGYSFSLTHDLYDYIPIVDNEPGWNIYFHQPKDRFSENPNFLVSRQDHVFLPVGEVVEISLDAYQFYNLKNCNKEANYSVTDCEEDCWLKEDVKPNVNCSGPWFPSLDLPLCKDFASIKNLIKTTILMTAKRCCLKTCRTTQYKTSIVKRTTNPEKRKLASTAHIYFSSKAVITMEESFAYDWNTFLADLGGSVGFLLGLSVISVIGLLEFIVGMLCSTKEEEKTSISPYPEKSWKLDSPDLVSRSPTLVAELDRY